MKIAFVSALLALLVAGMAKATPIPDAVAAMLDAAAGDPDDLKTVAKFARQTNPGASAEIDAKVAAVAVARAEERAAELALQGALEGWTGSGEAGAFASSGNTSNTGVAIGVTVTKDTLQWRHNLRAIVDYQREDGQTSKERWFLGYEGNYNITPNLYALLTLGYERDRFSGFDRRFSESIGLGYKLVNTPDLRVALEGGTALRQTANTGGRHESRFAARSAANIWWRIGSDMTLTQNASIFSDNLNTSLASLTALTAKLGGDLSARASFQLNTESSPPEGRRKSDTTSRLTLVYGF